MKKLKTLFLWIEGILFAALFITLLLSFVEWMPSSVMKITFRIFMGFATVAIIRDVAVWIYKKIYRRKLECTSDLPSHDKE